MKQGELAKISGADIKTIDCQPRLELLLVMDTDRRYSRALAGPMFRSARQYTQARFEDYINSLCAKFGVSDYQEMKGRDCRVLRAFPGGSIVGLEVVNGDTCGERFLFYEWVRKHIPNTTSPLEDRQRVLRSHIYRARRTVANALVELERAAAGYIDWSTEPEPKKKPRKSKRREKK